MRTIIHAGRSACLGRCSRLALSLLLLLGVQLFSASAYGMNGQPEPTRESVEESAPMAAFARMAPGEWRLGTGDAIVHATTWRWGAGGHSIRAHRVGSDVDGNPSRELVIYYWRPDRERVHLLSFHPDIPGIGRGVGEGTIEFDGDAASTSLELHQPGGRRELASRWVFDGPDSYRDVLLEDSGRGLEPLAEWEYTRSLERSSPAAPAADRAPTPSANIAAFIPFIGQWESWEGGDAEPVRSHFHWVEHLDVVELKVESPSGTDAPEHLLDAYLYHHVGFDELRCVAVSVSGEVYVGGVRVRGGRDLELDLTRHEGGASDRRLVRIELAPDGELRTRAWSIDGDSRTLLLDISHRRAIESQND